METYGKVVVRQRNGYVYEGELLHFLPLTIIDGKGDDKQVVYGVVETEQGEFIARSLDSIRRKKIRGYGEG